MSRATKTPISYKWPINTLGRNCPHKLRRLYRCTRCYCTSALVMHPETHIVSYIPVCIERAWCASHSCPMSTSARVRERQVQAYTPFSPIHRLLTIYSALLKVIQLSLAHQQNYTRAPTSFGIIILTIECNFLST